MKATLQLIEISGTVERCLVKVNPYEDTYNRRVFNESHPPQVVKDDSLSIGDVVESDDYELVHEMFDNNEGWMEWLKTTNPELDRKNGYKTRTFLRKKPLKNNLMEKLRSTLTPEDKQAIDESVNRQKTICRKCNNTHCLNLKDACSNMESEKLCSNCFKDMLGDEHLVTGFEICYGAKDSKVEPLSEGRERDLQFETELQISRIIDDVVNGIIHPLNAKVKLNRLIRPTSNQ